jgi:hypothetical protein
LFEDTLLAVEKLNVLPSQFEVIGDRDRARVIAFYRVRGTMEAYEHHLHEQQMKREVAATRRRSK